MRYTIRSLEECLSDRSPPAVRSRLHHAFSEPPGTVALPELTLGRFFLERMRVRELPGNASWRNESYESFASPLFVIKDAVLHSSAGILAIGDTVLEETLIHTSPDRHGYDINGRSIDLHEHVRGALPGRHASLLTGSSGNYFHTLIDCIARLAVVTDSNMSHVGTLLLPQAAPQAGQLLRLTAPVWQGAAEVCDSHTLEVDDLVLPWTVHGQSSYHPCIKPLFSVMADKAGLPAPETPKLIYVSRRLAANRRLSNEADLIAALMKIGFTAVRLETLNLETQILLFRGADMIVAPHGAGLSNIVFAAPTVVVLELLMDSYVNWCFRHLAAVLGLRYDCVIGRAHGPWSDLSPAVHGDQWTVSVPHVIAAAQRMMPSAVTV